MPPNEPAAAPLWLWRLARGMLAGSLVAVAGLAAALALGAADVPRAGPLAWEANFTDGAAGWTLHPPPAGQTGPGTGALQVDFAPGPGSAAEPALAFALRPGAAADFTLEVAGAAAEGSDAAYGLVFAWADARHYSAVLVNGNGYAEAYRQDGDRREQWFAWQQWPHILAGASANRVRVDARGQSVTVRINDEVLVANVPTDPRGQLGAAARSAGPGRVVFNWARLWHPP